MRPLLLVEFGYGVRHASRNVPLTDWMRGFKGAHWSKDDGAWVTPFMGRDPDREMREAGLYLVSEHTDTLAPLTVPVVRLSEDERHVIVYPRLMGLEAAQKLVDHAGMWKPAEGALYIPIPDVLKGASPRPGIAWPERAVELAYAARNTTTLVDESIAENLARLSGAIEMTPQAREDFLAVQRTLGGSVGPIGVELLPYQKLGAIAAAGGHNFIADSPGVGKTFQGLAAARARRIERLLVIAPPVALQNWAYETLRFGGVTEDELALFRSTRKVPTLDGKKVVFISDAMLASRPESAFNIGEWLREAPLGRAGIIYDEAHRMKTSDAQRTQAVLRLKVRVPGVFTLPLTGTPLLQTPAELVPILEFSGHLVPVFGSAGAFYERYCNQGFGNRWAPKMGMLRELNQRLNQHVWVRRTKAEVLPFLPDRRITAFPVAVATSDYRQAHKDVLQVITSWLNGFIKREGHEPSRGEIREWAKGQLSLVTMLRRAAGLAKIAPAMDLLRAHFENESDEPVIVWVHHRDVGLAMVEAANGLGVSVRAISGLTSAKERDSVTQDFQAGKVKVLVASITAAGVAITLTRGHHAIFVESDWTPSLILQAIDRQHRLGQEHPVEVLMMVALETLDEYIQARLSAKGTTLERVLGDDSNSISVSAVEARDALTPVEILASMVETALENRGKSKPKKAAAPRT